MSLYCEVQRVSADEGQPKDEDFLRWAQIVLENKEAELVIRIVDEDESRNLNMQYRQKNKATNVLSFPFEAPPGMQSSHIGDLVICAPVVKREAAEQGKNLTAHWAHMTVHGILHLLGYDHLIPQEASIMENMEINFLKQLGYDNPYEINKPYAE